MKSKNSLEELVFLTRDDYFSLTCKREKGPRVPLTQSKTSPTQHILDEANCDELNNGNVDTKAAEVTEIVLLSKFQHETLSTRPNKVRPINRGRFDESLSGFFQAGIVAAKLSDRVNL